jgi:glycosyltransferase involved in cell wall biosynthesis
MIMDIHLSKSTNSNACGNTEKKNVLILNFIPLNVGERGGAERRLMEVTKYFVIFGIEPHIMEYSQYPLEYSDTLRSVIRINRYFSDSMIGDILRILYIMPFVFLTCFRQRVDAVYINKTDSLENIMAALLIQKILRKPLFLILNLITPESSVPIKKLVSHWKSRGVSMRGLFRRLVYVKFRRYIHVKADVCFSVSQITAKEVQSSFGNDRFFVTGNGIDLSVFMPKLELAKLYEACYFGRLEHQKGTDVLLKCWKYVVDKFPNAKLLIIGEGNEKYTLYCKSLGKQLGLENNIIFTGWVSDDEVVRLLNISKIFVFPSRYEGFALAVAEAMACGLCCVISDIPVLRENFSGAADFAGLDNPNNFADLILHYLQNEKERIKLGLKAVQLAQTKGWDSVAKIETRIIKSIVRR